MEWHERGRGHSYYVSRRCANARDWVHARRSGRHLQVISYKAEGVKFKLVYEFDAQGTLLQSATEATVKGKTIEGAYKTTAGDQAVDSGTWTATAP
jgi:hypothetical protein